MSSSQAAAHWQGPAATLGRATIARLTYKYAAAESPYFMRASTGEVCTRLCGPGPWLGGSRSRHRPSGRVGVRSRRADRGT